jgi:hypothetical protein
MHFSYMGWYHCSACDEGKSMSHDDFQSCCRYRDESCRYRNESFLCNSCYEDRKRKDCGKCGSNFCENHGNVELTKCCDQFLCKSCNEDGDLFLCDICRNEDGDEDDDEDDDDDDGKRENIAKTVPPENNSRKRDGVDDDDVVDSAKSNKKRKADADVEVIVVD